MCPCWFCPLTVVNHLVPGLMPEERANLSLTCTTMSQHMAGTVAQVKFDGMVVQGKQMCYAAKSPRLLQLAADDYDWHQQQLVPCPLQELRPLGYVAASDSDLPALTCLTALQSLELHLQKPSRGLAGRVTLRGLWGLAQQSRLLAQIKLTIAMETLLLVAGHMPGVMLHSVGWGNCQEHAVQVHGTGLCVCLP